MSIMKKEGKKDIWIIPNSHCSRLSFNLGHIYN